MGSTSYDPLGRPYAVMNPLGQVTTTLYDDLNRKVAVEDANGHRTTTSYDALWRPYAVTDPLGHTVTTLYDLLSRPTTLMDARGYAAVTEYDAVGRPVLSMDPLGQRTTYQYEWSSYRSVGFDAGGQLALNPGGPQHPWTRLDARGRLTTYTLDFLNRPVVTEYSDGSRVTRTYDPLGREAVVQDSAGVASTSYDAVGRVWEVVQPTGQRLSYAYDSAGNRAAMQDPSDGITSYAWDANNRLTGIVNPYGEVTTITLDALGREWNKTLGNGMVVSHAYDAAGRETVLADLAPDGSCLTRFTATYDPVGSRTGVEETVNGASGQVGYAYDAADQLTHEWRTGTDAYDVTYTYDPAGNRATKEENGQVTSYEYDEANELLVVIRPDATRVTYTYDANGNQCVVNDGGQVTTFTWDDDNRMVRVEHPDATVEEYAYAPDGLRRKKETPEGTILFVRDGQNVLVETNASLVVQAHNTQLPGVWGELVSQRRGSDSSFYGFDLQGSTRVLVSVGGVVTDSESFRAFGESLAATGTTIHPYRYIGKLDYYQDALNRYKVGLRDLDTKDGRWKSRDPIWPQDGPNAFLYAKNEPLRRVDPSGLQSGRTRAARWRVTIPGTDITGADARALGLSPHGASYVGDVDPAAFLQWFGRSSLMRRQLQQKPPSVRAFRPGEVPAGALPDPRSLASWRTGSWWGDVVEMYQNIWLGISGASGQQRQLWTEHPWTFADPGFYVAQGVGLWETARKAFTSTDPAEIFFGIAAIVSTGKGVIRTKASALAAAEYYLSQPATERSLSLMGMSILMVTGIVPPWPSIAKRRWTDAEFENWIRKETGGARLDPAQTSKGPTEIDSVVRQAGKDPGSLHQGSNASNLAPFLEKKKHQNERTVAYRQENSGQFRWVVFWFSKKPPESVIKGLQKLGRDVHVHYPGDEGAP